MRSRRVRAQVPCPVTNRLRSNHGLLSPRKEWSEMIRSLVLFTHVVGVLALFVGLALEWIAMSGIRRSTTLPEALPWLRLVVTVPRVSGIAVAAIVLSGFYLGARIGVLGNDWIRASYGGLLLMAIVGGPVSRSPMRALKRVADVPADGTVALRAAAANPILQLSLRTRVAFGLAIVFLMIAKPATGESLLVLVLASIATIATSLSRRPTPSTAVQEYR
jgi:hypothetical protein